MFMSVRKKVVKHIHKHKHIFSISLVMLISLITILSLYFGIPNKNGLKVNTTSSGYNSVKAASSDSISANPLNYEFITINNENNTTRYVYFTTETADDRLVALNDKVLTDLRNSKKITNQTESFYIDYFSNKETANIYYEKIKNNNLSQLNRLKLISSYIASMNYLKSMEVNNLIKITSGTILKQY